MKVSDYCYCTARIIALLLAFSPALPRARADEEGTKPAVLQTLAPAGVLRDFAKARAIYLLRLMPNSSGRDATTGQAIEIAVGIEISSDASPIGGCKRRQRGV